MAMHAMEQVANNAMHHHQQHSSEAMHNPTIADVVNALASENEANLASLSETPIKTLHIPVAPAVPEPTYYVLEIDRVDSVKLPVNTTNNNNSDNTSSSSTNQANVSSRTDVIYTFSAQPGKAPSPAITSQAINTMPTSITSGMNTPSAAKGMNTTPPISSAATGAASTAAAMAAASALSNHSSSSSMANLSSANIPSMYRGDFNSMANMRQWAMNNAEHNNNSNTNTSTSSNANRLGPHSWQNMNGPSLTSNNNNNVNTASSNTNNNNATIPQSSHPSSASTSALSASAFSAAALSAVANNASAAAAAGGVGGGIGGNNHLGNVNMDYWSNPIIA